MTITFLHALFASTFKQISDIFKAHDSFRPTNKQLLENQSLDKQIEYERTLPSPQVNFFLLQNKCSYLYKLKS